MRPEDLEHMLGAIEQVLNGVQRAARQDTAQGIATIMETIARAAENVARPPPPTTPPSTASLEELARRIHRELLGSEPTADLLASMVTAAELLRSSGLTDALIERALRRHAMSSSEYRARSAPRPPRTRPPPPPPRQPPPPQPQPPRAEETRVPDDNPAGGRRINIRKKERE